MASRPFSTPCFSSNCSWTCMHSGAAASGSLVLIWVKNHVWSVTPGSQSQTPWGWNIFDFVVVAIGVLSVLKVSWHVLWVRKWMAALPFSFAFCATAWPLFAQLLFRAEIGLQVELPGPLSMLRMMRALGLPSSFFLPLNEWICWFFQMI